MNFVLIMVVPEEADSRLLALLLLRALVVQLRGERLSAAARRVLDALRLHMHVRDSESIEPVA